MRAKKVAIIGGGIAGLACAFRLHELLRKENEQAYEVRLFENDSRIGGHIKTQQVGAFLLETGPDSFICEKPVILNLADRLGIRSRVIPTEPGRRTVYVLRNEKLLELPEGFQMFAPTKFAAFLKSPLFSAAGKFRAIFELFLSKKKTDEEESVAAFIRRRFGREVLDRVVQPMVSGIYAGNPETLSMKELFPRFIELEKKYGSVILGLLESAKKRQTAGSKSAGPRYGLFQSFDNGMEVLSETIAQHLPKKSVQLNAGLDRISWDPLRSEWRLSSKNANIFNADILCLAIAPQQAAGLLCGSTPRLSEHLGKISYQSIATVQLAYSASQIGHPLDSFGFIVPAQEKKALLGCTFSSRKFKNRAPEGYVLMRAFAGGFAGQKIFQMNDQDLVSSVERDLASMLRIQGRPVFSILNRFSNCMPQYELGHSKWLEDLEAERVRFEGLFFAGSSYRGSGLTNSAEGGIMQAEAIWKQISAKQNKAGVLCTSSI